MTILDEPSASLDPVAEQRVQQTVPWSSSGSACLLVSHRLSTIRDAHLIMVLHDGMVAEVGTHDDLASSGGLYAHMFGGVPTTSPTRAH